MHGPNFLAPQHPRTKHRMERTLCIGFIDFKKAFDSIHHETLFSILYKSFECSVLMDSTQTDYFPVKSGVRQ